jgi:flagellin
MALTVNTNMSALNAANTLNNTQGALSQTLARVSSGMRITRAADDAAGAAVAQNLSTQARSGRQAMRNANDGISVIQTAEAATKEVTSILDRIRELAVQSSSDTLASTERAYIQTETSSLLSEVSRIAQSNEFNGISLSNGSNASLTVQVGVDGTANSQISITLTDLMASSLGVDGVTLTTAAAARSAIATVDTAIDSVNSARATYGSAQNRLESSVNNMSSYVEALTGAASQIQDADYAHETAEMTRLQVMQQAGVAALGQARSINTSVIGLLG